MFDPVPPDPRGRNDAARSPSPSVRPICATSDVFSGEQCRLCGWHLRTANNGACPICAADTATHARAEREGGAR